MVLIGHQRQNSPPPHTYKNYMAYKFVSVGHLKLIFAAVITANENAKMQ